MTLSHLSVREPGLLFAVAASQRPLALSPQVLGLGSPGAMIPDVADSLRADIEPFRERAGGVARRRNSE